MAPTHRSRTPLRRLRSPAGAIAIVILTCGAIPSCDAREPPNERREPTQPVTDPPPPVGAAKRRTDEARQQRYDMVARQIAGRGVLDPAVLNAMRTVPRHWFVPDDLRALAYSDRALPIGEDQTISQPYIVALMTEALKLTSESKVLEVGTGSGYQAAVLSEITPHVYSIEIVEPLARRAKTVLEQHGYDSIRLRVGDGYAGWPEAAPFDAIIVTCAPDHVPPRLIEQLKIGGRLCIPVGGEHNVQQLVLITKTGDATLERKTLSPVRFVPMTGEAQRSSRD